MYILKISKSYYMIAVFGRESRGFLSFVLWELMWFFSFSGMRNVGAFIQFIFDFAQGVNKVPIFVAKSDSRIPIMSFSTNPTDKDLGGTTFQKTLFTLGHVPSPLQLFLVCVCLKCVQNKRNNL